ncbi:hypothetical protein ACFYNW_37095 [Streptomyces virginiae]|uniref:hypothetical protein n=1 Tax=Streptomyces virginiae TaxID=1961 RepID=UPI0033A4C5BD
MLCDDGMRAEAGATALGTTRSKALHLLGGRAGRAGARTTASALPVFGFAGADLGPRAVLLHGAAVG